jgi:hypothetical protein
MVADSTVVLNSPSILLVWRTASFIVFYSIKETREKVTKPRSNMEKEAFKGHLPGEFQEISLFQH